MEGEPRHQCLIYEGAPSQLLPVLAATIEQKLREGYRCLYLNSAPMVSGLRSCLSAIGIDVASEVAKNSLVLSSDSIVTKDGTFDIDLMLEQLENSLDQAIKDGYIGLWASGDITWEFGSEKNLTKLMEYESRLEQLFWKRKELCGICQYHKDTLPKETPQQALLTHPWIFINQTLSKLNPFYSLSRSSGDKIATNSELDEMISALCESKNKK